MKQLISAGDVCMFTTPPQKMTYSWLLFCFFLLLLVPMYTTALYQLQEVPFMLAFKQAGVSVFSTLLLLAAGLWYSNKLPRFLQTATALTGALVVLGAFMLTYMYLMRETYGFDGFDAKYATFPLKMIGGFLTWDFAILAFVIRHAFSKPALFSMGLAFLLVVGSWKLTHLIVPYLA